MDLIVEKATELGAKNIIPVMTEWAQFRYTKKIERWRKIALESSKQCRRTKPPDISKLISTNRLILSNGNNGLHLILYELSKVNIKGFLNTIHTTPRNITVFVGLEGGFSKNEVEYAEKIGFHQVGLGPRILGIETASISIVSIIQYLYSEY